MEILLGITLGLSNLLFVGPVFFYLLSSSIQHSAKAGICVAIGIIFGDIIYVSLLYNGLLPFLQAPEYQKWMAIGGAIILLSLGFFYLTTGRKRQYLISSASNTANFYFFGNGFILNFVNPIVMVVWIGFFSVIQMKYPSNTEMLTALCSILVVIFATDCLKVFFASKVKRFFTPSRLKYVRKLLGLLMFAFAIRLIASIF